jgi:hypothetical protein
MRVLEGAEAAESLSRLSNLALQRPPMTDHGLTRRGLAGRPHLRRDSELQPLDRASYFERVRFAFEAPRLDAAIVGHHLPEPEIRKRGDILEIIDRHVDANAARLRRHLLPAGLKSLPPARGADRIAEYPEPRVVTKDVFLAGRALRECVDRLDRFRDVVWSSLPRDLIVRADAADDLARRFLHAGEPALGEIRPRRRPGGGEQQKMQDDDYGQDFHRGDPHPIRNEPNAPA